MSGDVTRLRALPDRVIDTRSPTEKIVELQKALSAEVDLVEYKLVHDMTDMVRRLSDAASLPMKPGIRDEFRRLSDHISAVATRVDALRQRG